MTDPLSYLFGLGQFGIKFGLENMLAIVGRLGHPERSVPIRAHRRHQRQRLGDGDGRRRACARPATGRPATPRRTSSISPSDS